MVNILKRLHIISMVLVIGVISVSMKTMAMNNSDLILPMYTYVNSFANSFDVNEKGEASLASDLSVRNCDYAKINIYLDRYYNGVWSNMQNWSVMDYTGYASFYTKYNVTKGYSYRMRSIGYAYKGGNLVETVNYTSNIYSY